ncbi:MAG: hypothetical protein IT393_04260 [Nitrospirae bacterium]|nr:hypothetical protein [Nitrospirota bacterium]
MKLFEKYCKKYQSNSRSKVKAAIISADGLLYEFEERAAIMEYDGGLSRKEAESETVKLVVTYSLKDGHA